MRRRALLMAGSKEFQKHLIGYYPLDADFNDKIAPVVDLTASGTGSITLSPAVIGNGAFCPTGTNTALRDTTNPDRHKFSFTDGTSDLPFSISLHVNVKSVGADQGAYIWGKDVSGGSNNSTNSEYRLQVLQGATQIRFQKFSEGLFANSILHTITLPYLNDWFHLVITDDAIGNTKIYINGVEQYKITSVTGTGFVKFSQTSSSYVGAFNLLGVASNTRYLEGGLDDLGIFKNYVLTQEDIDWIWNGGNPRRLKNV